MGKTALNFISLLTRGISCHQTCDHHPSSPRDTMGQAESKPKPVEKVVKEVRGILCPPRSCRGPWGRSMQARRSDAASWPLNARPAGGQGRWSPLIVR